MVTYVLMILPVYAVLGSDGSADSDPINTRKHPGGLSLQNGEELIMHAVYDMRMRIVFLWVKNMWRNPCRAAQRAMP